MTAQQIVTRLRQRLGEQGIQWREQTVDTFKAGSPDTDVRGIATTGMATFDLLQRAAARDRNFVITHEPTFYNHLDQTAALEQDPTYQAKQQFIRERNLVVFRFHDHTHMLRPDPLIIGSARALGLTPFAQPDNPRFYTIQPTALRTLVTGFARRLNGRAMRVMGDPEMVIRRIVLGPGSGVPVLATTPEPFDLSIGGETAEAGGNAEYILDAAAIGQKRAMILLGHMLSEDWGMQEVADWMRPLLPGVTVEWIGAGEPFSS
jgi:putative NIF3 family GTP cyclohydrolase 1 type 2